MSGITPTPTISYVEMQKGVYDDATEYAPVNNASVRIEISDSISETFESTSWFVSNFHGTEVQKDIINYMNIAVLWASTEEAESTATSYITALGGDPNSLAALGGLATMQALGQMGYTTAKLTDYVSDSEADEITNYYAFNLMGTDMVEYAIPFDIQLDFDDGDYNPASTNYLVIWAYVYWDMEAIAAAYGLDLETSYFNNAYGAADYYSALPDPPAADYILDEICGEDTAVMTMEITEDSYFSHLMISEALTTGTIFEGSAVETTGDVVVSTTFAFYASLRNIIMKNSIFGFFLGPDFSDTVVDTLMEYVTINSAELYRYGLGHGLTSGYTGEGQLVNLWTPEYGSMPQNDSTVSFQMLDLGLGGTLTTSIKTFYWIDPEVAELDLESGQQGYIYSVVFNISDNIINYFVSFLDELKGAIDWITEYKTHTQQPCNYNSLNNKFNEFFQTYIDEVYTVTEYEFGDMPVSGFEGQLNAAIDKIITAAKLLRCTSDSEAVDLQEIIYAKLHPETARPNTIEATLQVMIEFENAFANIIGLESLRSGRHQEAFESYADAASGETNQFEITKTFSAEEDQYFASSDNYATYMEDKLSGLSDPTNSLTGFSIEQLSEMFESSTRAWAGPRGGARRSSSII
jgi:hypothetical protein